MERVASQNSTPQTNGQPKIIHDQQQIEAPETHLILPTRFVGQLAIGSINPSVKNVEKWKAANTVAINITNFRDGQEGQELSILGDGFSTVNNNTKIVTNTGADKLLAAGHLYRFTMFDGVWIEDASD